MLQVPYPQRTLIIPFLYHLAPTDLFFAFYIGWSQFIDSIIQC